jgi:hypothetical protein
MIKIKQNIHIPETGGVPPRIRLTQYDTAVTIVFTVYNGTAVFAKPSDGTVRISMTKPDKKAISTSAVYNDDGTIELQITQQMTAVVGEAYCKLSVIESDGQVSTASFILDIAAAGVKDDAVISESVISDVEKVLEAAEFAQKAYDEIPALQDAAIAAISNSESDAETAIASDKTSALSEISAAKTDAVSATKEQVNVAKSWAVGDTGARTGEDTNNAKYYAEQAKKAFTGVSSFNGRTGAVTPQSGDYSYDQISNTPTIPSYSDATASESGLMSAEDKAKLDGIAEGANKITVDSALSETSENPVQNKEVRRVVMKSFIAYNPISYQDGSWGVTLAHTGRAVSQVVGRTESGGWVVRSDLMLHIISTSGASSSDFYLAQVRGLCDDVKTKLGGSSYTITEQTVPAPVRACLSESYWGYGVCAYIDSSGIVKLGRIYTETGSYGAWPLSQFQTGSYSFGFYFVVNP